MLAGLATVVPRTSGARCEDIGKGKGGSVAKLRGAGRSETAKQIAEKLGTSAGEGGKPTKPLKDDAGGEEAPAEKNEEPNLGEIQTLAKGRVQEDNPSSSGAERNWPSGFCLPQCTCASSTWNTNSTALSRHFCVRRSSWPQPLKNTRKVHEQTCALNTKRQRCGKWPAKTLDEFNCQSSCDKSRSQTCGGGPFCQTQISCLVAVFVTASVMQRSTSSCKALER